MDVVSLLSNLTYSYHGFHNVSVFATEVQHPATTYRRVLFFTLALVPLTYFVPMAVAVASRDPKWTEWTGNSVAAVFLSFGGPAMHVLAGALLVCSASGLYLMSLLSSAFLASGMMTKRFGPMGVGMYVRAVARWGRLLKLTCLSLDTSAVQTRQYRRRRRVRSSSACP